MTQIENQDDLRLIAISSWFLCIRDFCQIVIVIAMRIRITPIRVQLNESFLKWMGSFFFSEATLRTSILRFLKSSSLSPLRCF